MSSYQRGDAGPAVAQINGLLHRLGLLDSSSGVPGDAFDTASQAAVRAFQQHRGLTVDGRVDSQTFRALDEARWCLGDRLLSFQASRMLIGDDVAALQHQLQEFGFAVDRLDGLFGPNTQQALMDFQRSAGLPADGTCGPATFKALQRLRPRATGGRPEALWAAEHLRLAGPALTGKVLVVDPGHGQGAGDDGWSANGLRESEITYDLASRIEGRLGASGVRAYLSRGRTGNPGEIERAEFVNGIGANLCVSLHCDGSASSEAPNGVATFYYGNQMHQTISTVGEKFAGLVQREIVARTGLLNLGTHPKTWDLLRYTQRPAIRVEVGYLTNSADAARLADPAFRDVLAEAVVVAVQRVYLAPENDPTTGVLQLGELRV